MTETTYRKLEQLEQDQLFELLTKAGVDFPGTKPEDLSKEELLLVADEADQTILETELKTIS